LYLGETVDPEDHERTGTPVLLDADDLTTHGFIVGMTGSGKTGLGIVLIEEALLQGIPVLVLDPKGDLGNLALTFPGLAPSDFAPWVEGSTADEVAARWRDGLASWGIDGQRVAAVRDAATVTIYTPGSTAGVPLNIVGSLTAPADPSDLETMRDEVEGFVSGLLAMVGIESDPLSSREHILLANLIEHAWSAGRDLDLAALIGSISDPPVRKLGVFDIDTFFPADDRRELAMRLNGLLASPAFAAWSAGAPLAIDTVLRDGERPRAAIVSLAHLSDEERQFVVTAVLGKLVTWMRRQPGTDKLRVLVYFDEVMGFVPPLGNPPAKQPILTLMKQARAFGVGLMLATQNPVDIDYKGISNAGTWMVGRLQTDQDKARLLDGFAAATGGVDVAATSARISGLDKREFVLRRAGTDELAVFTTRWAMSYLRGPLTREQIASLMAGAQPEPTVPSDSSVAAAEPAADQTTVVPEVASGIPVRFMAASAPWASDVGAEPGSTTYAAAVAARVELLFDDEKADLRHSEQWEAVIHPIAPAVDPATAVAVDYDDRDFTADAPPGGVFVLPAAPLNEKRYFTELERTLTDHLYRRRTKTIFRNPELKLFSRVDETPEQFAARCDVAAQAAGDEAAAKLRDKYEARVRRAQEAVGAAQDRYAQAAATAQAQSTGELAAGAGALLGAFLGGRRNLRGMVNALGGSTGRRGRTAAAQERVGSARRRLAEKQATLQDLEADLAADLVELDAEWQAKADVIEPVDVPLEKSDIRVSDLAVVWVPLSAP
jgi:DNA helicase HerA-like ATPase